MSIQQTPSTERLATLQMVLRALCFAALIASVICIAFLSMLMTVGFDEAWNLLSVRQVFEGASELSYVKPVLTSGGLYAVLNGSLYALGVENILWHRLVTALFFFATILLIYRHVQRSVGQGGALVAAAVFASVPGGLYLSSGSYAEPIATLLVILVALQLPVLQLRTTTALALGLVCGIAAATRSPAVVFTATAALYVLMDGRAQNRFAIAALFAVTAAATFLACTYGYILASPTASVDWGHVAGSTGLAFRTDYPFVLNKLVTGDRVFPAFYLAGAALLLVATHDRLSEDDRRITLFCLLCAGTLAAFWLLVAPIPHLRYLWPALPLLWTCLAIIAASLYASANAHAAKAAILGAAIFLTGYQVLVGSRNVLFGNNDLISFEHSGESAVSYFRWLAHKQDEQEAARLLSALDARVVYGLDDNYPLELLTRKPFIQAQTRSPLPGEYLLLNARNELNPTTFACLESNAGLVWQTGPYSLYRMQQPCSFSDPQHAYTRHPHSLPAFGHDRIEYEKIRRGAP